MRVSTTIFLAFPKQNDDQESATSHVSNSRCAEELPLEFVSIFEGKNRVIVIEQSED